MNVIGPETVSVRYAAIELGKRLGIEPQFIGNEAETALLSNASATVRISDRVFSANDRLDGRMGKRCMTD